MATRPSPFHNDPPMQAGEYEAITQFCLETQSDDPAVHFVARLIAEINDLHALLHTVATRARLGGDAQDEPARMYGDLTEIHHRIEMAFEQRGLTLEIPWSSTWQWRDNSAPPAE